MRKFFFVFFNAGFFVITLQSSFSFMEWEAEAEELTALRRRIPLEQDIFAAMVVAWNAFPGKLPDKAALSHPRPISDELIAEYISYEYDKLKSVAYSQGRLVKKLVLRRAFLHEKLLKRTQEAAEEAKDSEGERVLLLAFLPSPLLCMLGAGSGEDTDTDSVSGFETGSEDDEADEREFHARTHIVFLFCLF